MVDNLKVLHEEATSPKFEVGNFRGYKTYFYMKYLLINACVNNLGVQVGRMGCVPARGRNSNSRNVSCSQPSLHRHGAPSGMGAI